MDFQEIEVLGIHLKSPVEIATLKSIGYNQNLPFWFLKQKAHNLGIFLKTYCLRKRIMNSVCVYCIRTTLYVL